MEQDLIKFCFEQTKDRDSSHNYEHMIRVCELSKKIMEKIDINTKDKVYSMVCAGALLHDICDHKYITDDETKRNMKSKLEKYMTIDEIDRLMFIIDNISYSKEKRGDIDFEKINKTDLLIRNIISDADKLEAIGIIGIKRCCEYARHIYNTNDESIINNHLIFHYNEKLNTLSRDYIKTAPAKEMAIPLNAEMTEYIKTII